MVLNRRFEFEPFDFETEFAGTELERLIAELDDQQQTELAPGSCPDVPVPASRRPWVLVRGSVHSAVREIQRKLNAFHAYQVAAGLPGLRDAPLVEDCIFGKHTYTAVKSFQELVFPGLPAEHDGKVGPHTWGQLDAIVLGPGPGRVARLTVEQLRGNGRFLRCPPELEPGNRPGHRGAQPRAHRLWPAAGHYAFPDRRRTLESAAQPGRGSGHPGCGCQVRGAPLPP